MNLNLKQPISHFNQFVSIEQLWSEFHAASSTRSIFLSFDYVSLWYSCFARPEQVRIYPIFEESTLIGFLPLILRRQGPVRVLSSLTNDHCLHAGPLVKGGFEGIFGRKCIDTLLEDKNGWDVLRYYDDESTHNYRSFEDPGTVHLRKKEYTFPTYTILRPDTYDEYFNHQLSSKMRKSARNEKNRLAKNESHRYLHYIGQEAAAAWPAFLSIEDSGWKGSEGSSILKVARNYRMYYDKLVELMQKNDQLHIYFLEIDGQVAAGLFCYSDQEVFHACKSGYTETFSMYSPSNQLMLHVIEDVIKNFPAVKRINLFPWGHGYKHRYINEQLYCSEVSLFNSTLRGRAAFSAANTKEKLKRIPVLVRTINFLKSYKMVFQRERGDKRSGAD